MHFRINWKTWLGLSPRVSDSLGQKVGWHFLFLTNSLVLLILLAPGPHFENYCIRITWMSQQPFRRKRTSRLHLYCKFCIIFTCAKSIKILQQSLSEYLRFRSFRDNRLCHSSSEFERWLEEVRVKSQSQTQNYIYFFLSTGFITIPISTELPRTISNN